MPFPSISSLSGRASLLLVALGAAVAACGGATPAPALAVSPAPSAAASAPAHDTAQGGRLFDKWTAETKQEGASPERLKNLLGWDLRGTSGMYGPSNMAKKTAISVDLLTWQGNVAAIADRLAKGDGPVPAYGSVLSRPQLEALASFVVAERDGTLPRADSIITLTSPAAKDYALRSGGNAEHGKKLFASRCAGCHGTDGTQFLLDDGEFSLGSHARQKAYEDWFKILNGQPGTGMKRQVTGSTATEMTQEILDILTALCDRTAFPVGKAKKADVADGDPRCGAALR